MSDETAVRELANHECELCGGTDELDLFAVEPARDGLERSVVLLCGVCRPQQAVDAELDSNHWYCLQGAIWSEVTAVQVLSWRLLQRLTAESWAQDLLGQAYLTDDVLDWAQATGEAGPADDRPPAYDSNGALLADGDAVTLIKDLDVKGAGFTAKRGTLVRPIRLTDNPEHVEGRVNKMAIVLKTEFLKKAQ